MKKKLVAVVAGVLAAAIALSGCSSDASSDASGGGTTKIKLATGGTSGTYYAYGGVIAQAVTDATGISFDVQ